MVHVFEYSDPRERWSVQALDGNTQTQTKKDQHVKRNGNGKQTQIDAEISMQIPAQGVTHVEATMHMPAGLERYTIMTFIFSHMQRHTHNLESRKMAFMDATCPPGI